MALILFSELFESSDTAADKSIPENFSVSYEEYEADMEKKLKKTLESIDGVGEAEVMVTVTGTQEYIYAQEEKVKNGENDYSAESEYVIIGSGGEKQALLKKVVNPEISGVVIICEGGESNIVKERVYSTISAAFNIPTQKIYVTKLK
ncbi:MAG: hypothetical protein ACI4JB_10380 [Porcipelethomonas sp.]